jgi:acyl-CoA reductase-like NAD-dependent aldehyde dehydrogenase
VVDPSSGDVLRRAFELMTRDAEHLVRLVTLENGKALTDARGEVTYAAESSPGRVGDPARPPGLQALLHRQHRGRAALLKEAADQVVNCSMELGGDAPFLVFADADLDAAVEDAMIDEDEAAVRLASERLDSGGVGLNSSLYSDPAAPFGGTEQSGLGREGGHDGMLDHLESTDVAVQW